MYPGPAKDSDELETLWQMLLADGLATEDGASVQGVLNEEPQKQQHTISQTSSQYLQPDQLQSSCASNLLVHHPPSLAQQQYRSVPPPNFVPPPAPKEDTMLDDSLETFSWALRHRLRLPSKDGDPALSDAMISSVATIPPLEFKLDPSALSGGSRKFGKGRRLEPSGDVNRSMTNSAGVESREASQIVADGRPQPGDWHAKRIGAHGGAGTPGSLWESQGGQKKSKS